ncbi:hypothetical protein Bhyg_03412, partial [Pseudolycoriella hygida]
MPGVFLIAFELEEWEPSNFYYSFEKAIQLFGIMFSFGNIRRNNRQYDDLLQANGRLHQLFEPWRVLVDQSS